ncbi:MAG: fumarylacetoacetate hydrolase family protein [Chlorobi bacterium]|nr:fumarylacetoacetate hydrolase family protein [Chlorobiota bacterium]
MKIICIGRNYAEHIKELHNERPEEPVVFIKPDTALVPKGNPLFLPDFSNDVQYETELVLRINRLGKHIPRERAKHYYDAIGLGIDVTARDLQQKLKAEGLPWEKAKAFDFSAVVSREFIPTKAFGDLRNISFSLRIDGETVQRGNSRDMIWDFDELISHVSRYFTLRTGDLLFTGSPPGVGRLRRDTVLEGFIGNKSMFKIRVK